MTETLSVLRSNIDTVTCHIDTLLGSLPLIQQAIESISCQLQTDRIVFTNGTFLVFMAMITLFNGFGHLVNFIGFLFPLYLSFKALKSDDRHDDSYWLTYWVSYVFLNLVESTFGWILSWIPGYHLIKLMLLVVLFHPSINGSKLIFVSVVDPIFSHYEQSIDSKLRALEDFTRDKVEELTDAAGSIIKDKGVISEIVEKESKKE